MAVSNAILGCIQAKRIAVDTERPILTPTEMGLARELQPTMADGRSS
jgi:hypothetical protein